MAATSLIISGPAPTAALGAIQGKTGTPTGNFTITPNDVWSGVIGLSDWSLQNQTMAGGTFTPSSLSWNGTSTPQTFTYTPARVGTQIMKVTSYPNPGFSVLTKSADLFVLTTS